MKRKKLALLFIMLILAWPAFMWLMVRVRINAALGINEGYELGFVHYVELQRSHDYNNRFKSVLKFACSSCYADQFLKRGGFHQDKRTLFPQNLGDSHANVDWWPAREAADITYTKSFDHAGYASAMWKSGYLYVYISRT